jgi:DHA3 family macrolide efflux protein-like MFS transporter
MGISSPESHLPDLHELLQYPAYIRLFSAGLASTFGFATAQVCIIWLVYSVSRSPLTVAYIGIAATAGLFLGGILAGPIVDRYNRKQLMVVADLGRSLTMGVFLVSVVLRGYNLEVLLATSFTISGLTALFTPAEDSAIPLFIPPRQLVAANGLIASSRSVAAIVGASVSGLLIVIHGAELGFLVCSATFLASALFIVGLTGFGVSIPGADSEQSTFVNDLTSGFSWLADHDQVLWLTVSSLVFNFCALIVAAFIVFYTGSLAGSSPALYGGAVASISAGTAIGPLLALRLPIRAQPGLMLIVAYGMIPGVLGLILGLAASIPTALVAFFLLGASEGVAGTVWLTVAQSIVPSTVQGRVFAADSLASTALFPAAQITGGFLVASLGPDRTYSIAGAAWLIAAFVFLGCKPLRTLSLGHTSYGKKDNVSEANLSS